MKLLIVLSIVSIAASFIANWRKTIDGLKRGLMMFLKLLPTLINVLILVSIFLYLVPNFLFAFQGQNIVNNPLIILLAAVPLVIQTYFIFFIAWYGGKKYKNFNALYAPQQL